MRNILAPLLPQPPNSSVRQLGLGRDRYILGVLPRNRVPTSVLNPEEAIVPTRLFGVSLNYYEIWRPLGGTEKYYLDRAYMHIHLTTGGAKRQVLALHCDPALNPSEHHYQYKRGPHMHIEGAVPSVSRAHISVCLLDNELGGAEIGRLTTSFRAAVVMVAKELFPCWERVGA